MNKAVIFDFGGTLDTNGIHWSVMFLEIYKKLGLEFTTEQYNYAYVKADEDLKKISGSIEDYKTLLHKQAELHLKYIFSEKLSSVEIYELANRVNEDIMLVVDSCLTESKKILGILKKSGYILCIVSNFYGNLEKICDNIGFGNYMDILIDSEVVKIEKPNPGIFSLALQKLNVKPENTFVVGDSYERDIVPPKGLGCKTIWLRNRSFRESESVESADYTINNLGDILRYLT